MKLRIRYKQSPRGHLNVKRKVAKKVKPAAAKEGDQMKPKRRDAGQRKKKADERWHAIVEKCTAMKGGGRQELMKDEGGGYRMP